MFQCGENVKKLKIKFTQNMFIGEPNPNTICIGGCNPYTIETLGINLSSVRRTNQNANNTILPNNAQTRPQQNNPRIQHGNNPTRPPPRQFRPDSPPNTFPPRHNNMNGNNVNNSLMRPNNTTNNWMTAAPGPSNNSQNGTGDEEIVCLCNAKAVLLTVRKDGENKGRKFYKCDKKSCDFFLWAAEGGETDTTRARNHAVVAAPGDVLCNCREPAVRRVVGKDGVNKGRPFWCCHLPRGAGNCGFFQWADEVIFCVILHRERIIGEFYFKDNGGAGGGNDDDHGGGGPPRNPRNNWKAKNTGPKNNRPAPYQNPTRAKRKCSRCGQEGHTKPKCPN